jgi:tetratricopeptide (TPR) repeat protein
MAPSAPANPTRNQKRQTRHPSKNHFGLTGWHRALMAFAAFLCCVELYSASVHGPFVFDDFVLPFVPAGANHQEPRLVVWMSSVRPILMFSYWLNFWWSGLIPFSYHFVNLLLHTANSILVFLIVEKLLVVTGWGNVKRIMLASLLGAVFLVHPLQTESVSYIAGRSESLGGFFLLCAWCLFLYRRGSAISWKAVLGVLFFFALAVGSKENMAVLPAVLLLTDAFLNPSRWRQAVRANWRLYVPIACGFGIAAAWVFSILSVSLSAGFGLKELTPANYFFTEARAILVYLRLFILPAGQALDHEFAVSHNILEHGAIFSMLILAVLTAVAVAGWKRYRLASFGFLLFLVLLSPTSSFIPIADPLVERRMYLPLIGLLLVAIEVLGRVNLQSPYVIVPVSCLLLAASVATYRRNILWTDPWLLWRDSVVHSPTKARGYSHLATFAVVERRCQETIPYLEKADQYNRDDPHVLMAWAEEFECLGQNERALAKLQRATVVAPTSYSYELLGLLYGEMRRMSDAKRALDTAVSLAPAAESPYLSRAYWYEVTKDYAGARTDYSRALAINPTNFLARAKLLQLAE